MTKLLRLLAAFAAVFAATSSYAQNSAAYPARSVKIVVPFAPAGPTDVMARLIAQKLSAYFGKQFYVENHPGAGGNIGDVYKGLAPVTLAATSPNVLVVHRRSGAR